MSINFPINPLHGQQFAQQGIPITWQFDSGRNAWRIVRTGSAWMDIVGKPSEFPPSEHEHPISDVTGLQNILDVKQDISARAQPNGYPSLDQDGRVPENQLPFGLSGDWNEITNKPATFPPDPHTHPVAQISDSSSIGQQIVRAVTGADVLNIIGGINQDGNARVTVKKNDGLVGVRRAINLKEGSNVTMTVADDPASEEVDVTINAGGGGGGASITVSEIKPAAPLDSSMWLDAATGILFIYYNDGNTSQWIEALPYLSTMPGAFTKFDFPPAPVDDQLYNPIPGATWKWSTARGVWFAVASFSGAYTKAESDSKFVDIVGDVMTGPLSVVHPPTANTHAASKQYVDTRPNLTVSDTPPAGAVDGALWWESDSGLLYVRYNDGSSSQWVMAAPQPDTSVFLTTNAQTYTAAQQTQVRKNVYAAPFDAMAYSGLQINGAMEIGQERGMVSTQTSGAWACDGWRLYRVGTMVVTAGLGSSPYMAPGLQYSLNVSTATAQASLGAGDYVSINQYIEGWRVARLAWGTAGAQPLTIAFWSNHIRTGIYSVGIVNGQANNRGYFTTYTQVASGVPQYNVVTIPGDTAGTWLVDAGSDFAIIFALACGTTYTVSAANTWLAGNFVAAPGQVNGVGATSDIFRISGVMLLPGNEAPVAARSAFVMRTYDQELLSCRRYYQSYASGGGGFLLAGYAGIASATIYQTYPLSIPMRAIPAVSFTNVGYSNASALVAHAIFSTYIVLRTVLTAAGHGYANCDLFLDARI